MEIKFQCSVCEDIVSINVNGDTVFIVFSNVD